MEDSKIQRKTLQESPGRLQEGSDGKNGLLRKARLGYINTILEDALASKDSKPLFRHQRTQKTDNSGIAPLKDGGQVYSDACKKADILAK